MCRPVTRTSRRSSRRARGRARPRRRLAPPRPAVSGVQTWTPRATAVYWAWAVEGLSRGSRMFGGVWCAGKTRDGARGRTGRRAVGVPSVFPSRDRAGSPRRVLRRGGCPIRCAVAPGSDGTRIGFEGTHVIVDLDENIAEVVQVRHQHVRIHRPTNPARPRSVLGDSNRNSEKGAVTARAPSVLLSAKGRRG